MDDIEVGPDSTIWRVPILRWGPLMSFDRRSWTSGRDRAVGVEVQSDGTAWAACLDSDDRIEVGRSSIARTSNTHGHVLEQRQRQVAGASTPPPLDSPRATTTSTESDHVRLTWLSTWLSTDWGSQHERGNTSHPGVSPRKKW